MQHHHKLYPKIRFHSTAGFTLLEHMIVVAIMGILSAIAVPGWLGFVSHQQLNSSQDQVYQALQAAKSNAKRDKTTWQVSFREVNQVVQWAVHPAEANAFVPIDVQWHHLASGIQIDKQKNNKGVYETTFDSPGTKTITGPWRVQFNYHGNTNGLLGQITLIADNNPKTKRCVYVSTLIGAIRTGQDHVKANSNKKYCY